MRKLTENVKYPIFMHGGIGEAEIHNEAFGSEPIFSSSILYFLEL